jgi:peptide/nickel transport system permease protein
MSVVAPVTPTVDAPSARVGRGLVGRFCREWWAVASLAFFVLLVAACFAAPLIAPYGPNQADFLHAGQGPSLAHLLGTDSLGRDVLSRMLYGGARTLSAVAVAVVVAFVLGTPAGVLAGYLGGRWDRGISWLSDGIMALPATILLLAVLAVFPHNLTVAMIAFGILVSPALAKVVRAVVLGIRHEQYIDAARVSGIGEAGIMRRHVASKTAGPVVIQLTVLAAVGILVESGLDFLGLGPQPPTATWGTMVQAAAQSLQQEPWLLIPTGGTIAITVLALWLIGDGVRDAVTARWSGTPTRPRRSGYRRRSDGSGPRPRLQPADQAASGAGDDSTLRSSVLGLGGLTVAFPDGDDMHNVVENVGLTLQRGETVALLGESGCGKSVTARAIMGLLPASAAVVSGEVLLDGALLRSGDQARGTEANGNRISMIFQEPAASLDPSLTVGRLLTSSVRRHRGLPRQAARAAARELLTDVGIKDADSVMRRYPHELSGGMAQRVCIARALAGHPQVLIADEPTTALDVTVQAEVLDLLRDRQERTGLAILFVTHDFGVVADIADRCIVMYAGQVVETAPVDQLFTAPHHPYTAALLAASTHAGRPGERLPALPGRVPNPREWPTGCRFQDRCPLVTDACRSAPIPLLPSDAARESRCIRSAELLSAPGRSR